MVSFLFYRERVTMIVQVEAFDDQDDEYCGDGQGWVSIAKRHFSKSLDSSPDLGQQSLLIGWWSNFQTFNGGGRTEKTSFFHNDICYHRHQHRQYLLSSKSL